MPSIAQRQTIRESIILSAQTVIASSVSELFDIEGFHNLRVNLSVDGVVSGTNPTLDIEVRAQGRTFTDWFSIGTMTQVIATAARETVLFDVRCIRFLDLNITIGGTDTPTFTDTDLTIAFE